MDDTTLVLKLSEDPTSDLDSSFERIGDVSL
jgi:hypothetical protein